MDVQAPVWVVDDDADDQYIAQMVFSNLTRSVTIKSLYDGSEPLPCLQQATVLPQLILLDLNMPRFNGFDVLQQVSAIPIYEYLLIVILTTSKARDDQEKALRLGVNDVLSKPATLGDFSRVAEQLVDHWVIRSS